MTGLLTLKMVYISKEVCQHTVHMAHQEMVVVSTLLLVCLMFRNLATQQCGIDTYSIYQKMLKGHTFKTFRVRPMSHDCRHACNSDVRCQSYNYVMFKDICELNNRTKEARPEDFVKDVGRYYMEKISKGIIEPVNKDTNVP